MSRAVAAVVAGVVVLAAVVFYVPFLRDDREASGGTPQPFALDKTATIPLAARARACLNDVTVEPRSDVARIQVGTFHRPGVPLTLSLRGSGYAYDAHVARYADNEVVSIPLRPPPQPRLVTACVTNDGRRGVTLYATGPEDRGRGRGHTRVDGRPVAANFDLLFFERRPVTLADRLGLVVKRMQRWRPGVIGSWLLWPLALLFVLGVPAGVAWALARAARDEL